MYFSNILLASVALTAAPFVHAAKSTTRTETVTVFLPQHETGTATGGNIYATVITSNASTTEYLLACQTDFSAPKTCVGDFNNVTLTYAPSSSMGVAVAASTYNCSLGASAVCSTKTASTAIEVTTTLNATVSAAWMTPITVLDDGKKRTTKKKSSSTNTATATAGSSLCKRRTGSSSGSSGGSSDSSSGSSSDSSSSSGSGSSTNSDGTASTSDSDDSTTSSGTKKNTDSDSDSCSSGASLFSWDMGIYGLLGTVLAAVIAL